MNDKDLLIAILLAVIAGGGTSTTYGTMDVTRNLFSAAKKELDKL